MKKKDGSERARARRAAAYQAECEEHLSRWRAFAWCSEASRLLISGTPDRAGAGRMLNEALRELGGEPAQPRLAPTDQSAIEDAFRRGVAYGAASEVARLFSIAPEGKSLAKRMLKEVV